VKIQIEVLKPVYETWKRHHESINDFRSQTTNSSSSTATAAKVSKAFAETICKEMMMAAGRQVAASEPADEKDLSGLIEFNLKMAVAKRLGSDPLTKSNLFMALSLVTSSFKFSGIDLLGALTDGFFDAASMKSVDFVYKMAMILSKTRIHEHSQLGGGSRGFNDDETVVLKLRFEDCPNNEENLGWADYLRVLNVANLLNGSKPASSAQSGGRRTVLNPATGQRVYADGRIGRKLAKGR
jgi:hypothetical protein